MAQYRNISVRSPFYIQHPTSEDSTNLEIRLWYGDVSTAKPTEATYTLDKEQTGGQSTFEIAELVRDYCSQTSVNTSGSVWVETILDDSVATPTEVIYLATEGYTLYKDGIQHNGNSFETDFVALPLVFGSTTEYRYTSFVSGPSYVPIYVQPQNATDWKYRYIINGVAGSYTSLPIETENDKQFKYIVAIPTADYIEFDFNGTVRKVYIDAIESTKYSCGVVANNTDRMVNVSYVNKFGVRSQFPFTLKHIEDISVSSSSFLRNTMDVGSLSNGSGLHASRKRITGSKQSFEINTDWFNEYHVAQLEELLMSEYVWALIRQISSNLQPVNLKTNKMIKKNHLNDKLIQYSMKIETASEYMNTVR